MFMKFAIVQILCLSELMHSFSLLQVFRIHNPHSFCMSAASHSKRQKRSSSISSHFHCYLLRSLDPKHPVKTYVGFTVRCCLLSVDSCLLSAVMIPNMQIYQMQNPKLIAHILMLSFSPSSRRTRIVGFDNTMDF